MNDDPNLTAHGDEALETRIIAWTLGEASAFEAAELERLCAERPELNVFRRRMLSLHEALVEQSAPAPDDEWKLSSEKRAAIARLTGVDDQARAKSTKRSSRNAWIGIAACLVLSITLYFGKDAIVSKSPSRDSKEIVVYSAAKPKSEVADMSSSRQESAETHAAEDAFAPLEKSMMIENESHMPASPSVSAAPPLMPDEALASSVSSAVAGNSATPEEQGFRFKRYDTGRADSIDSSLAENEPLVRSNAARSYETSDAVTDVRRNLSLAEGNLNLGKTDEAKADYEDALRVDPYNQAARRGLEKLKQLETDSYRASNDRGRAELLAQVDQAWELSVAAEAAPESKWKRNSTLLTQEITAADEPYSTFSLNVSDVSFRMAQAAMAKGERPEAGLIKPEQFYNAFDYGDPAPAAGEPVALAMNQAAHPVLPQRTMLRISLKTAASGRGQGQPLRLTLVADQSGSMARPDRQEAMEKALNGLAGLLNADDQVSVVGFSRTPRLLGDSLPGDQAGRLPDLVNQAASEGGTNLEEALKLGSDIAMRNRIENAQNRIVMLTDGAANLGDAKPERLAARITEMRQNGLAVDVAGIAADELNDELLAELARNGNGRYYVVGKDDDNDLAKRLAGAFRPAAENVKVQVRFNPERVLRYKLIGFEKDRLNKEDFRNDAVDAAELAAEEAGVAIYQLETVPEGSGEIGEVSVRFRDTASGEMVERGWTIPHESMVPSLDRAEPAMQLAALATLTAEKLQGGALAEAIEAKPLAPVVAQVRQQFRNDARVSELLTMFDQVTRE